MGIYKLENPSQNKGGQNHYSNSRLNINQEQKNNQKIKFLVFKVVLIRNPIEDFKVKNK